MYNRLVVNLCLRTSLHLSATVLPERQRSIYRSLIERPLSHRENKALNPIRKYRSKLLHLPDRIETLDFGAGGGRRPAGDVQSGIRRTRSVAQLAAKVAVPDAWGVFLFKLVRDFGYCRVLELGTSLGIGAAYFAKALELNGEEMPADIRLTTIEGDPATARWARDHLAELSGIPIDVVCGTFPDKLPVVAEAAGPFNCIFVDGHHAYGAVLDNYARVREYCATGGVVVFDDIEPWSFGMRRAWKRIRAENDGFACVDAFRLGLLFG